MQIYTQSKPNAAENMAFDRDLLGQTRADHQLRFRLYTWESISVTYPERITLPADYAQLDAASRPSGGGIVFHHPGELGFTCAATLKDPHFPPQFRDKLCWFQDWIAQSLTRYPTSAPATPSKSATRTSSNHAPVLCTDYPSPYELHLGDKKILGLAIRRYKDVFLVQGVVHLSLPPQAFIDSFLRGSSCYV